MSRFGSLHHRSYYRGFRLLALCRMADYRNGSCGIPKRTRWPFASLVTIRERAQTNGRIARSTSEPYLHSALTPQHRVPIHLLKILCMVFEVLTQNLL
jgi:hypothetical protein